MENTSNRHDLTDRQWESIIQKQMEKWGGSHANDTRTFINGVCWILRTGSHPGETYPMNTAHLAVFISVINVGVIKVTGKPFLKNLQKKQIFHVE